MGQITTRMEKVPPRWRLAVLALVALAMALLVAMVVFRAPVAVTSEATAASGDVASYGRIVERLRGGQGYYEVAHEVLVADGYGTRSVFNWRTPAWPVTLAVLPPGGGQILLGALAAAGLLLVVRALRGAGTAVVAVSALAVAVNFGVVLAPEAALFAEVPAGMLILISVAAYASGWRWLGVFAGLAALVLRELAAPYVLVAALVALRERNWREFVAYAAGFVAYAAYFAWHWAQVLAQLGPTDRAYEDGWIAFGGLDFVLATAGFNGLWALGPDWIPAILLPLGLLGLWAWPQARALAAVGIYVLAFLVIGKPFNAYWGAVYTPVLMLGLGWVAPAVAQALQRRSTSGS